MLIQELYAPVSPRKNLLVTICINNPAATINPILRIVAEYINGAVLDAAPQQRGQHLLLPLGKWLNS